MNRSRTKNAFCDVFETIFDDFRIEAAPKSLKNIYKAGPAHGPKLWRGSSKRKVKILGGQLSSLTIKSQNIGGAAAPPPVPSPLK